MTHGALNIYIYDTQHLKHNGFTETVPVSYCQWSDVQSCFKCNTLTNKISKDN